MPINVQITEFSRQISYSASARKYARQWRPENRSELKRFLGEIRSRLYRETTVCSGRKETNAGFSPDNLRHFGFFPVFEMFRTFFLSILRHRHTQLKSFIAEEEIPHCTVYSAFTMCPELPLVGLGILSSYILVGLVILSSYWSGRPVIAP